MFLLNGEYEVPIVKDYLRGLVFVDSGSLASSFGDLGDSSASTRAWASGSAFRSWDFERVPISLYLAAPVVRKSHRQEEVFSFTIGTGFEF